MKQGSVAVGWHSFRLVRTPSSLSTPAPPQTPHPLRLLQSRRMPKLGSGTPGRPCYLAGDDELRISNRAVSPPYPRWRYFPSYSSPPDWVAPVVAVFTASRPQIDSAVVHPKPMQSNDVLAVIATGLQALNFTVETGKQKAGKLPRPVFFGDEGTFLRTYEIDAFEPAEAIALEVEAGRATMGNAIYRDLIQASLMVDATYLVLAVPSEYRYKTGGKVAKEPSYTKTYSVVEAVYGSPRLNLPFEGLLLIGY